MRNETKHTPGPWYAKGGQVVQHRTGRTLALVPYYDKGNEEQDQTAQVMAAAPELLEALERVTPWIGKMIADGAHLGTVLPGDCEQALSQARGAIEKAKHGF